MEKRKKIKIVLIEVKDGKIMTCSGKCSKTAHQKLNQKKLSVLFDDLGENK